MKIEILKEFYSALNRNDISALIKLCDPEIERIEFQGSPSAGTFRGLLEMKEHVSKGRETWAEGGCEPEEFIAVGDRIVVDVHVRVRLKNKVEWIDGHAADAFSFRNGKVLQMHTFFEKEEALSWAKNSF